MRLNLFGTVVVGSTLAVACVVAAAAQQTSAPASSPAQDQSQGQGRRGRGMGGFAGGGRGVLGAVTEVAADHYTIKTDSGETYIVHFSANTRIVKQGPGRRQGGGNGAGEGDGAERATPQTLKPTDIKVGDFITAGGEVDAAAKSVGAVFIAQVDPERAKQMREMQANYGKTWLAGRITAIDGTTITIDGIVDHTPHSIVVDENTSFHQHRDAITLADIKPGEQLRAEGAIKSGAFLATTVTAMEPQNRGEGRDQNQPAGSPPKPQ
jgi:preprotein translocase subunit YajC